MPGDPAGDGDAPSGPSSSPSSKSNRDSPLEDVIFVETVALHNRNINQSTLQKPGNFNQYNSQYSTNSSQGQTSATQKLSDKNAPSGSKYKNINLDNKFKDTDAGPFFIFVEHKNLNIGRMHPMKLGEKLLQLSDFEKHIKEISRVGRNRIKIELDSGSIANKLVIHPFFPENEYVAFIPSFLTEKRGVVRFVDTSYSESALRHLIDSDIPIKHVHRMNRAVRSDDGVTYVPRQIIIVTFEGLKIPQYIYINKVRCPVDAYIQPVVQCFNCLRFGHTSSQCKSRKRCKKCASDVTVDCEDCTIWCVFCKNNTHQSVDKKCPEFIKQKKIKEAMTYLNVSFKEAELVVDNPAYTSIVKKNRFFPLLSSDADFPSLSQPPKPSSAGNNASHRIPNVGTTESVNPNPKKRKPDDSHPHFTPIRREFNTSFCSNPIINSSAPAADSDTLKRNVLSAVDMKKLKNKMVASLGSFFKDLLENLPPTAATAVSEKFKLEDSLNNIVDNIFSRY